PIRGNGARAASGIFAQTLERLRQTPSGDKATAAASSPPVANAEPRLGHPSNRPDENGGQIDACHSSPAFFCLVEP
ncbi:hypothetical protein, partial [Mesorhizobium sp. M5C.F.Ca.ET.164.01.1.1]|uniref:hypothetical protein n=1 Tax=Mesorhizobium sp. M5C.F.Ca.ET.164.01.1.1 TaxID=2563957 RepID=UPI001AEF041F